MNICLSLFGTNTSLQLGDGRSAGGQGRAWRGGFMGLPILFVCLANCGLWREKVQRQWWWCCQFCWGTHAQAKHPLIIIIIIRSTIVTLWWKWSPYARFARYGSFPTNCFATLLVYHQNGSHGCMRGHWGFREKFKRDVLKNNFDLMVIRCFLEVSRID